MEETLVPTHSDWWDKAKIQFKEYIVYFGFQISFERGRTRKSSSKKRPIFLHFSSNISFPENILL